MVKFIDKEDNVLLYLIPIIMFQAGFSLQASTFFRNIFTIGLYAIIGTILSSVIFAFLLFFGCELIEEEFKFLDSLHFGCLISAIDPVATASIYQNFNINDGLYSIIFGESIVSGKQN
jgi:NhaP-type Na+/H+ or K+/H+ antiporter